MRKSQPMLSIIIINYKDEENTNHFVRNELCKIKTPHIVVIVNNSSSEESNIKLTNGLDAEIITRIDNLVNRNKYLYVISQPENLGFAKANNLGVIFSDRHFDINHVLFSNSDIHILQEEVVEELIKKIDSQTEISLIGPKVLGLDGKNQSPEPYISFWLKHILLKIFSPVIPKKIKTRVFKLDYSELANEGFHYKIMGSFFIVKLKDFIECGMMDTNTFLYAEELILSERLKKINRYCYYYPRVTVLHEHSQTISRILPQYKSDLLQFKSECYFYRTYKNLSYLTLVLGWIAYYFNKILKRTISK